MTCTKYHQNKHHALAALILCTAVIAAELVSLYLSVRSNGADIFRYYTENSNNLTLLFALIAWPYMLRRYRTGQTLPRGLHIAQYVCTCMLTLTLLVVIFVLGPMLSRPQGGLLNSEIYLLTHGSMLYRHTLCPIMMVAAFLLTERCPLPVRRSRALLISAIPTALYAAVIILLVGTCAAEAPYPFLQVRDQPPLVTVMWCVLILGGYLLIALAFESMKHHYGRE